jgi:hypothetical protein
MKKEGADRRLSIINKELNTRKSGVLEEVLLIKAELYILTADFTNCKIQRNYISDTFTSTLFTDVTF